MDRAESGTTLGNPSDGGGGATERGRAHGERAKNPQRYGARGWEARGARCSGVTDVTAKRTAILDEVAPHRRRRQSPMPVPRSRFVDCSYRASPWRDLQDARRVRAVELGLSERFRRWARQRRSSVSAIPTRSCRSMPGDFEPSTCSSTAPSMRTDQIAHGAGSGARGTQIGQEPSGRSRGGLTAGELAEDQRDGAVERPPGQLARGFCDLAEPGGARGEKRSFRCRGRWRLAADGRSFSRR